MRWWLCKVTEHRGWNGKDTLFSFLLQSLWHEVNCYKNVEVYMRCCFNLDWAMLYFAVTLSTFHPSLISFCVIKLKQQHSQTYCWLWTLCYIKAKFGESFDQSFITSWFRQMSRLVSFRFAFIVYFIYLFQCRDRRKRSRRRRVHSSEWLWHNQWPPDGNADHDSRLQNSLCLKSHRPHSAFPLRETGQERQGTTVAAILIFPGPRQHFTWFFVIFFAEPCSYIG